MGGGALVESITGQYCASGGKKKVDRHFIFWEWIGLKS